MRQLIAAKGPDRVSPFLVPMMLPDTAAGQVAIQFGLRGPNMAVVTACASGNNAIGEAAECIRRGAADVMLAGGAEAAMTPIAVAGFNEYDGHLHAQRGARERQPPLRQRARRLRRSAKARPCWCWKNWSMRWRAARRSTAKCSATARRPTRYHITAPEETGAGAAQAMQVALQQARLRPDQIDYINAHGTSTPLNDKSETAGDQDACWAKRLTRSRSAPPSR